MLPDSDILCKMRMERNGDVRLARGFVAVRNRTKAEINSKTPSAKVREEEKNLFKTHKLLKQLEPEQWGIPTLIDKIVTIQRGVVSEFIPMVIQKINDMIREKTRELKKLEPGVRTPEEMQLKLIAIVSKIVNEFRELVDGRDSRDETELHVAARAGVLAPTPAGDTF